MSDFFQQNQTLLDSDVLNSMLARSSFTYHGMPVKDLEQVLCMGFKTRLGKCNFSIDPGYVIRKYATLGENTRHYYSTNYQHDLYSTAKMLGIGKNDILEDRVKKVWAESSKYTTLLILSTESHILRPGLGNKLYLDGKRILGGLSKWLHFHLTLLPAKDTSFWNIHKKELQETFLFLQDKRYSRKNSTNFHGLKLKDCLLDTIQPPFFISPDQILGFLKVSNEIRHLVDKDKPLEHDHIIKTLSDYLCRRESWFYLNDDYKQEIPLLVINMTHGLFWGRLIYEFRKLFLSMAVNKHYTLIKIDSPQDVWDVQLYSHQEITDRMFLLKKEEDLDDKQYREYKRLCLKNLSSGLMK